MESVGQLAQIRTTSKRRDNFKRLAEKRTTAVLERLRILGNLSNRSAYDFSEDDVRKIFAAIDREVRLTKSKFESSMERKFRL